LGFTQTLLLWNWYKLRMTGNISFYLYSYIGGNNRATTKQPSTSVGVLCLQIYVLQSISVRRNTPRINVLYMIKVIEMCTESKNTAVIVNEAICHCLVRIHHTRHGRCCVTCHMTCSDSRTPAFCLKAHTHTHRSGIIPAFSALCNPARTTPEGLHGNITDLRVKRN